MSADTNRDTRGLSAADKWQRKLDQGALTPADDVNADHLADRFGGDEDTIAKLCYEAFHAALGEDMTKITMEHFETAAKNLAAEGELDTDGGDSVDLPDSGEAEADMSDTVSFMVETERESLESQIADLEAENEELRDRIETVQSQLGQIQGTLNRLALLTLGEADVAEIDKSEFVTLADQIESLSEQLTDDDTGQTEVSDE